MQGGVKFQFFAVKYIYVCPLVNRFHTMIPDEKFWRTKLILSISIIFF